jgi:GntR family transcriptional repressor for pyruvate dehydrogenase complex
VTDADSESSPSYGLTEIVPIASPTRVYEAVTGAICEYIERASLSPGDRIPSERDLAGRLRVSRASVRQAMTELRVMGLIEIRHGDGAYLRRPLEARVPAISPQVAESEPDYAHLREVRIILEPSAARLAAQRREPADLDALRHALALMRDEVRSGGFGLDGNRSFHSAVAHASHNPVLIDMLTGLGSRIDRLSEASLSRPNQAQLSLETHDLIFEAIQQSDPDAAEELMRDHLRITSAVDEAPLEDGVR